MRLRERTDLVETQRPQIEDSGGSGLDGVRAQMMDLSAAGRDAINRALSGNSEKFLDATRQDSGQ